MLDRYKSHCKALFDCSTNSYKVVTRLSKIGKLKSEERAQSKKRNHIEEILMQTLIILF